MLEIAGALAVVLVIVAVPRLRRTALSLLGLFAIIAVGSAVFGGGIWGLYQFKPWLIFDEPAAVQGEPVPAAEEMEPVATPQADLTAALAAEDAQRLSDEQQRLEEERLRLAIVVARARVILEEDRKLAAQATSYPLSAGVGDRLGDIMAIRIPSWRDKQVAAVQQESIRTWLRSIGLSGEEMATIVTAKAWGSLYDLWVAENPATARPIPQAGEPGAASTPPGIEPVSDPETVSPSEAAQEPPPLVRQAPPPRMQFRPAPPKRADTQRRQTPSRRSPEQRGVGPFGY